MSGATYEKITTWAGLVAAIAGGTAVTGTAGKYGWVAGLVSAVATGVMGWAANKGVVKSQ